MTERMTAASGRFKARMAGICELLEGGTSSFGQVIVLSWLVVVGNGAATAALISLKLNGQAFDIYLVFFGFWCVLIGYLIFRSTFLPRILGGGIGELMVWGG